MRATETNVFLWGSRGGGKSITARFLAHAMALKHPGFKYIIVRRSFPELTKNHLIYLAKTVVGGAALSAVPKVMGVVERATAPATAAQRNALRRFTSIGRAAAPLSRVSSMLSRFAGPIGVIDRPARRPKPRPLGRLNLSGATRT